ncbi:MAG: septum formation protein Maf [Bauldia sp.]|nr:septum formation protein Maf [Bauldia sp.]
MTERIPLVLASASPRRLQLLGQMGVEPDRLLPTAVDETPRRGEIPRNHATRLAKAKAEAAKALLAAEPGGFSGCILAADTVVAVGRRILPQADTLAAAESCLRLLSGRNHRVFTGVALVTPKGRLRQRVVETRVQFKRLSHDEIEAYLASGEWRGKAGGYAIQGFAAVFVQRIIGSYSNVVGLPIAETAALLDGEGYPVRRGWLVGAGG